MMLSIRLQKNLIKMRQNCHSTPNLQTFLIYTFPMNIRTYKNRHIHMMWVNENCWKLFLDIHIQYISTLSRSCTKATASLFLYITYPSSLVFNIFSFCMLLCLFLCVYINRRKNVHQTIGKEAFFPFRFRNVNFIQQFDDG